MIIVSFLQVVYPLKTSTACLLTYIRVCNVMKILITFCNFIYRMSVFQNIIVNIILVEENGMKV